MYLCLWASLLPWEYKLYKAGGAKRWFMCWSGEMPLKKWPPNKIWGRRAAGMCKVSRKARVLEGMEWGRVAWDNPWEACLCVLRGGGCGGMVNRGTYMPLKTTGSSQWQVGLSRGVTHTSLKWKGSSQGLCGWHILEGKEWSRAGDSHGLHQGGGREK